MHQRQYRATTAFLLGLGLLASIAGCPNRGESTTVREVVGTIEEIDLQNKRVKVKAYLEKHETYETFLVHVTNETEILINGSLATLNDVKEGERAEGRVRVNRSEGRTELTALAVSIERGEVLAAPSAEPGAADAPAQQGTSGAAPPE